MVWLQTGYHFYSSSRPSPGRPGTGWPNGKNGITARTGGVCTFFMASALFPYLQEKQK
jgi:hypothetical protein